MHEVSVINGPCLICRTDTNPMQYIRYGELVVIFENSNQALAFTKKFPMFFELVNGNSPYGICDAKILCPENIEDEGCVYYNSIADKMDEELRYQLEKIEKNNNMKGVLKDE